MAYQLDDTIVAQASPPGAGLEAIVRLSGSESLRLARSLIEDDVATDNRRIAAARAEVVALRTDHVPEGIPARLYLWPTRRSFTGEPSAEIHMLGAPPLIDDVVGTLVRRGARMAEPGEFTLRAFLAGRIDLTQAEAVLGVIEADHPRRLHAALAQLAGNLADPLAALRDALLDVLARLEAGFDFADEDIDFITMDEVAAAIRPAQQACEEMLQRLDHRAVNQPAARCVLVGPPNAGKSSLFNALLGETSDRVPALVTETAGTTRDYLTATMRLGGASWLLVDTAGIAPVQELRVDIPPGRTIDCLAQDLAADQHATAHLLLVCQPISSAPSETLLAGVADRPHIFVWTKCDRASQAASSRLSPAPGRRAIIRTSAVRREGVDRLAEHIAKFFAGGESADQVVPSTALRCRDACHEAMVALRNALDLAESGSDEELVATELRAALDALGRIAGSVHTEDVLERVFSRFCVGK